MSQNAPLSMPNAAMLFSGANGSPESLNALRNQQYLAQLARHQSELTQYSAKQMEYLDQQRRYQQSMIDHQAGAALLMQKQQQDLINEQMKQLKASYGNNDNLTNDNTVGGRVLTARAKGVKTRAPNSPKQFADDDIIANDEHLREYFKEKYGINLSSEASTLTDEERETLKALKELLSKNKEEAIERGVFKTMESLKSTCSQCIPHDIDMMRGAWTQVCQFCQSSNTYFFLDELTRG
uniref:ATPase_AAA_core domain-containing protein n=1 Tax=Angiostrongylus cantonensis TaxID=6313 RepID=A0A0K0D7F1_ANGCA